jgi:hypothetical protein
VKAAFIWFVDPMTPRVIVKAFEIDDVLERLCAAQKIFVITAYWPDEEHFEGDYRTRRTQ